MAGNVIAVYDKRADVENSIGEAQREGILAIPSKKFQSNHAYFQIVMLAYNLWRWLKQIAGHHERKAAVTETGEVPERIEVVDQTVRLRNQRNIITVKDVHEAFRILQIDEAGLDQADRSYLDVLYHYGSTPLNLISSRLSKPESTVSRVLEPYLIRNEFVIKDRHSLRLITSKGKAHLEKVSPILKQGQPQ